MHSGGSYRGVALAGVAMLAGTITMVVDTLFRVNAGPDFLGSAYMTLLVVLTVGASSWPLCEPRSWRVTSLLKKSSARAFLAGVILVAFIQVGVPYAPSFEVAVGIIFGLSVVLPAWVWVLYQYRSDTEVLVVGDDPRLIKKVISELPVEPIGYLSPPLTDEVTRVSYIEGDEPSRPESDNKQVVAATDGGSTFTQSTPKTKIASSPRLSGLSRLPHVLRERNVGTVALAFSQTDRGEFFGVMRTCHDHGVDVLVDDSHENKILSQEYLTSNLIATDIEPLPWYSRIGKRAFDIAFAATALLVTAPLLVAIAVAIKLDSSGPLFYTQTRTAELGERFQVRKFRTMVPESEDALPGHDENRITRVGCVLRKTHLDEIPQLISILTGHMSVVGPRAAWIEEERLLEREIEGWRQRWHVKPGLTGLAQIKGADSTTGQEKLEFDLDYIDRQSFFLDLKIVTIQIWGVLRDSLALITQRWTDPKTAEQDN